MSLPNHLILEIVTPDRALAHEEVDEVQLPGTEGYLGILPGHTPLLTGLKVGQRSGNADIDMERARVSLMKAMIRIQVATKAKVRN
jgi:hypothetical protein